MDTNQFFTEVWTGIHDVPSTTHLGRALPDGKAKVQQRASIYLSRNMLSSRVDLILIYPMEKPMALSVATARIPVCVQALQWMF